MITFLQAQAILSILIAFGVPQITVNQVRDILIPPIVNQATTTVNYVPVTVTPVVENQPIYFGSQPTIIMETPKQKRFEIKAPSSIAISNSIVTGELYSGCVAYYSEDGVELEGVPVTVTTDSDGWFHTGTQVLPSITVKTRKPRGGTSRPYADVDYRTRTKGIHTLTFTANGISDICKINYK